MTKRRRIVVVGPIGRDLVLEVDDLSAGGSATVLRRRELLGGKGANQAVGLAQLGAEVTLVGVVGTDLVGTWLLEQARSDGIDTRAVVRRGASALLIDVVERGGARHLIEELPESLTLEDVPAAVLAEASIVSLQTQQPSEVLLRCAEQAGEASVACDGAVTDAALLARIDILRADARETEQMTGQPVTSVDDARRACADLAARGPGVVCVAIPSTGNLVTWQGGERLFRQDDRDVVDPTGGGDAFTAGLLDALARGLDPEQAGSLAAAAAAATVRRLGGRPDLSVLRRP